MAHVTAAERRPQLINAAIELMAREGVAVASTRAIAAELGVAQATVHYTFGTKEELYRAVLERLSGELIARVAGAEPPEAGFEETVAALVAALWRTVREQPDRHQVLMELTMLALRTPSLRATLDAQYREVAATTAAMLTAVAVRTGHRLATPAEEIAAFFTGAFDGLTVQRLTLTDPTLEAAGLRALVTSVLALAGGRPNLPEVRAVLTATVPAGEAPDGAVSGGDVSDAGVPGGGVPDTAGPARA
ncbi:TetR/AcrR family transcriptional regulator (plasmid) [Streptomyces sp. BI20]|uniref:TetR/AcrR family transcriptional regulator n=1 Tax=Streptomyces sp. BI20 TaxID=3403460 RepID=UPI003C70B47D